MMTVEAALVKSRVMSEMLRAQYGPVRGDGVLDTKIGALDHLVA
jgi:hypothetical protein